MYTLKRFVPIILIIIGTFFVFQSCSDSNAPVSPNNEVGYAGNGCDSANQFSGTPGTIQIQNTCPGTVTTIDLWVGVGNANAGEKIGELQLNKINATTLQVTYSFDAGAYLINSVHFDIAAVPGQLHQTKSGNPQNGQFDYVHDFAVPAIPPYDHTFNITLPAPGAGGVYYIAAHAGTTDGEIQGLNELFPLPDPEACSILSNVGYNYPNTYLIATLTNAGGFDGTYPTWCLDNASSHGNFDCVRLYSIYEPIPPELTGFPLIDHPENLVIVNWIINNIQAGVTSVVQTSDTNCSNPGASQVATVDDIQAAIWTLLDEGPGALAFDQEVVNGIICLATQHRDYDPCAVNQDMAIMVAPDPVGGVFPVQPIIIKVPCEFLPPGSGGGTAWADGKYGKGFPGNNWATMFRWLPN